jgi:hypothetical protein
MFMNPKTPIAAFLTKSKVTFATLAMAVTFTLTIYNQFKTVKPTEISGMVSGGGNLDAPVDAIVRISSPIQAQTETDAKGRFKFKFEHLQSDTFLLIVQNKTTNIISKQTEYVNAAQGRTDIVVLSREVRKDTVAYVAAARKEPVRSYKKRNGLKRKLRGFFR